MNTPVPLSAAPPAGLLHVVATPSDPALRRRLQDQGLRPGTPLTVVRRTAGGGLVVAVAGARLALGRDLARCLLVETRP